MLSEQLYQLMRYTTSRCVSLSICLYHQISIVPPSLHLQEGNTPLLRAAQKGHAEIVCFLLENGSNVEEQDNVGGSKGVFVFL